MLSVVPGKMEVVTILTFMIPWETFPARNMLLPFLFTESPEAAEPMSCGGPLLYVCKKTPKETKK